MPSNPTIEPPTETRQSEPARPRRQWHATVLPTASALSAAALMLAHTKDFALLGYDSYPIIIASRVQSLADFIGNFTEKLMDGRYPGEFYRPLLNWSFALDYALWGLRPIGYHLSNALLFGGCAAALFALARRLGSPAAIVGPLASMAFFLLHPVQFEVVPVPARRADLLCCLFLALSLTLSLSHKALATARPQIGSVLFGLLAIASKETGFVLPVLVCVSVLFCSPRSGTLKRARHALLAAAPHVVVAAAMFGARFAIIGGIGGHPGRGADDGPASLWPLIRTTGQLLVYPQAVMERTSIPTWLAGIAVAGMTTIGVLAYVRRDGTSARSNATRLSLRAALFGMVWLSLASAASFVSGRVEPWYLFLSIAGLALVVGAGADGLLTAIRHVGPVSRPIRRLVPRAIAAAALIALSSLAAWQVRYSPLFVAYDEYQRATTASNSFLNELRQRIDGAANGSRTLAPPVPRWVRPQPERPTVFGAAILTGRSIQAWAELMYPDRRVRVTASLSGVVLPPAPDELVVLLSDLRPGFEGPQPRAAPSDCPR